MKNILIFAGIAGIAAAIAIYFVTENDKNSYDDGGDNYLNNYPTDEDIAEYNVRENTGPAISVDDGFKPAY